MSAQPTLPSTDQPWRTCLDVEGQDAGHYLDYVNEGLYRGIDGAPGRVLELGCATGMFGKVLKERHPEARVTGIEASRAAAEVAAGRIDRVIRGRIEEIDLAAEGLNPGEFDLIVAGDVLEHLNNPWGVLERLRSLLSADGRLVASIPNVRNLEVVLPLLLAGRFPYADRGLLDVTHLRFFTFHEIRLMLRDTGYDLEAFLYTLSPALTELYDKGKTQAQSTLRFDRITITDVTPHELMELCAHQYVVRARPHR